MLTYFISISVNKSCLNKEIIIIMPMQDKSKKGSKDQVSVQLSTTPDPGYHTGK